MVVIITWAPVLWQPTELLKRNVFWAWVTVYCTSTLITAFTTPHKRTHTPACKLQPSRRAVQIWVRVNKALCSQPNMLRRVPPAVRPCLIAAQLFGPPHSPAPLWHKVDLLHRGESGFTLIVSTRQGLPACASLLAIKLNHNMSFNSGLVSRRYVEQDERCRKTLNVLGLLW